MYRTDFWTLWEKARVGCFGRTALKHVYYLQWNRSPVQVGCMRQVLGPGALGSPRGIGWRGRWEGGSGWGTHVNPWLIHFNVWQKPLQYCKVISLQLIKINGGKKDYGEKDAIMFTNIQADAFMQWIIGSYICQSTHPMGLLGGALVKNPSAHAGDARDSGPIPGLGRSPGARNSNPLQYSCLENSLGRGAWRTTVHRIAKSWTWQSNWACTLTHSHEILLLVTAKDTVIFRWTPCSPKVTC